MSDKTRPLPDNQTYQLSESGRLFGPCGQVTPWKKASSRSRAARYTYSVGGAKRKVTVNALMVAVWDIDFLPTLSWLETVCAESALSKKQRADELAERKKRLKESATLPPIRCGICNHPFLPENGNQKTCKDEECQRERQRRSQRSLRAKRKGEGGNPSKPVEPGPTISVSFTCPFTDHLNEKNHFVERMKTRECDFPDYSHAQVDPFGRYGDYERHAMRDNAPQQEKIAA